MGEAVNLAAKLAGFDQRWSPRTVATFNGHDVMVVKVEGEFRWHSHSDIAWLIADCTRDSRCAAARKLPASATVAKTRI